MRKKPTGYSSTTPVSAISDAVASESNGAGTTASTYDHRGRRKTVDAPDTTAAAGTLLANVTNTLYFPDGSVKETNGDQTYRTAYTYDYAARMKTLSTYRAAGIADTSTWNYESWSGRLSSKLDAALRGPSYTYTSAGRPKTRTWARGYRTRYDYVSGRLTATRYFTSAASDTESNAGNDYYAGDIGYTYNRLGQRLRAVTAFTSSQPATSITYAYNPSAPFQLLAETNAVDPDLTFAAATAATGASGVVVTEGPVLPSLQRTVSRKTDTLLRPTGAVLLDGATTELETTLAYYPTHGRPMQVTARLGGVDRNFYYMSYQYGSYHRVQNLTGPASSVYNYYDSLRGTLSSKYSYATPSWNTVSSYYYGTPNAIGQPTSVDAYGTAFSSSDTADWQWKYNLRGELASARNQPYQPSSTASRFYEFDGIGNRQRQREGVFADAGGTLTSYTPNALNQYTTITTASTVYPYHDPDGNMTSGPLPASPTGASLGWNGENRLSYISPWVSGSAWAYYLHDALGRRVMKTVTPSGGSTTRTYTIYDGWNLLAEYTGAVHTTGAPPTLTLQRSYAWGTDLSGSAQGAGGVGGLLAAQLHTGANAGVYYPTYDGNGNVSEYLNSTGAVAAHYEYGPFGEPLVSTGTVATKMPFRFSTKYQDAETGLLYYGYRYYDPNTGRWPNRDPIAEEGGVNLYAFVDNAPTEWIDPLGLALYAFDGTNNDGYRDEPNRHETNVFVLSKIYKGNAWYIPGVGTNDGLLNPIGLAFGAGGQARAGSMLAKAGEFIQGGDLVADIIGFSRGAAQARDFANKLKEKYPCVKIRWMGLFDTVASVGLPNDVNIGYQLGIPKDTGSVLHLTAGGERRKKTFALSSINPGPGQSNPNPSYREESIPDAVHSDVGGYYGNNRGLANQALQRMWRDGRNNGVPFGPLSVRYTNVTPNGANDSRWFNDKIVEAITGKNRVRKVYYHP